MNNIPSSSRRAWRAAALFASLMCAVAVARAGDFVVVSAEAIPQYNRPKGKDNKVQPQSYAFTEGKHFGANLVDKSDAQTTFRAIAEGLAPALAKQAYFPATKADDADLLVVVHWGTTQVYEDPNRELDIEQLNSALSDYKNGADAFGNNDPGRLNEINSEMKGSGSTQAARMQENAELLGYKRSLRQRQHRVYASEEEITMQHETSEERYFIILMAYDYPQLKKDKNPHLLWTTHMSVRAAGTNFRIALPQLTAAGANFFGHDMDDPVHLEANDRAGHVEVGQPTVVPDAAHK